MTEGALAFFQALAAETPFGLYVLDSQLRVAFFNEAAAPEFPGGDTQIGRDFYDLLLARHPEHRARAVLELFRRTLTTGEPHFESVSRAPRDTEVRVYEWALKRVRMPDGTAGVACYYHDVTTIQEAATTIAERADRDAFLVAFADAVRPLTDAGDITLFAAQFLGTHIAANQILYAEIDPDAHVGAVVHEWSDEHGPLVTGAHSLTAAGPQLLAQLASGKTVVVEDVRLEPMAGPLETYERRSLRSFVVVPLVKNDRFVALLGALQRTPRRWLRREVALVEEIAERTWSAVERARAESAVRKTHQHMQLALDAANMGAFVWYPHEDRTDPDARMLELFGLPPDGAINLAVALAQLIHPDDRQRYADAVARAMDAAGEGRLREDIRVLRPDGERWIAITARMEFVGEPPVPSRLVGMATDVTDRKRVEEALREREERLAESDRKKDEFLAILAHELRNPLAPIRTGVEVIRRNGMASGDAARVTEMMERQIGHMVRLIDDLLDISRITSGKIRLQRQTSDIRGLVESAIEANRAAIATAEVHLSVNLPAEPIWLDVDPARFVQIVSNILHNAVKFTDRDGSVVLSARVEDGALVLTVTDTGVGMSPDSLPHVFDLFMQDAQTARRAPGGLGIGLALARRLVEMHGGAIDATSPGVGRGSTFRVWLPLADAAVPRTQPEPVAAPAAVSRRVVVIDDNRDAADAAAMFVEDLGNEVRVAYDGETGVGLVKSFRPHLVLLDLGMEGVDGFETCRRIRSELGSAVYLVALTGWGQDHDKRATALAGFDAHLTKPADPAALERIIGGSSG
jgi:signal transduction histidine kinase/CheY-like chemotaxis protein